MRYFLFCVLPLVGTLATAADKAAQPGSKSDQASKVGRKPSLLKVGDDLPGSFNPYNATGLRKGKYHCLISQHGLNPMVLIFVRTLDLGNAFKDLLRKIDSAIDKNPGIGLGGLVV